MACVACQLCGDNVVTYVAGRHSNEARKGSGQSNRGQHFDQCRSICVAMRQRVKAFFKVYA